MHLCTYALKAGATGYLLKGTSKEDFLAAIDAVMRGNNIYFGQIYNIINKMTHTINVEKLPQEIIETEDKNLSPLEPGNLLLASEIINWWLTCPKSQLPSNEEVMDLLEIRADSKDKLFEFLQQGSSPNCNLLEELELRLDNYSSKLNDNDTKEYLENKLLYIEKNLADWYSGNTLGDSSNCCRGKLQVNGQLLRIKLGKKFQQFITSFWQEISPLPYLEYLEKLEIFWQNICQEYEKKQQNYLEQEKAGQKTYNYLLSRLNESSVSHCRAECSLTSLILKRRRKNHQNYDDYQIAIKALLHIYSSRIKAQICCLAVQALRNIIQINQFYLDALSQTNYFLKRLRNRLQTPPINQTISPLLFEQICTFKSPEKFQKELERELGHSLNQWGICSYISAEEVQHLLLEKTAQIVLEINEKLRSELANNYYSKAT